jgi:hypothetical protein
MLLCRWEGCKCVDFQKLIFLNELYWIVGVIKKKKFIHPKKRKKIVS